MSSRLIFILTVLSLFFNISAKGADLTSSRLDHDMEIIKARTESDTLKYYRTVNEALYLARTNDRLDLIPQIYSYSIGYKLAYSNASQAYLTLSELRDFVSTTGIGTEDMYRAWQNVIIQIFKENNPLRAMSEFHDMYQMAEETNDYIGLARASIAIGCISEFAYDEGIEKFNMALDYAKKADKKDMDYFIYYEMAVLSYQNQMYDEVIKYTANVLESEELPEDIMQYVTWLNLSTYMDTNDKENAHKQYLIAKDMWDNGEIVSPFKTTYAKVIALYESMFGNPESVPMYLSHITDESDRLIAEIAYFKAKGNYKAAFDAVNKYDSIQQVILVKGQKAKVTNANAFYSLQQLKGMNQKMKMENVRNVMILILVILIIMLVAVLFITFTIRKHNRQLRAEKDLTEKQRILAENQSRIADDLRKVAENERFKAERERNNAVKLSEMKSTFLHNMSHEMRTPLNSIIGFNQLLNDPEAKVSPSERRSMVEHITFHSKQLMKLLDHVTILSRIDGNDAVPVPTHVFLPQLISEVAAEFAEVKPNKVFLDVSDVLDGHLSVKSDKEFVRIVLRELIDNAIKFTKNGLVSVKAQAFKKGAVQISVSDMGPGIPPDTVERIFRRFDKLNAYVPGFGLGLSCCKELLEILKSDIRVDHTYTNGARFIVTLFDLDIPSDVKPDADTDTVSASQI